MQPLPGIGDMVWHVPHLRAIAAFSGAPVTVLTKPRSLADQLLRHEPSVERVLWVDRNPRGGRGAHDGPLGLLRLIRDLRAGRFASAVVLHHSESLAAAAWLAGIPDRRGYGRGVQRWFLTTGPWIKPEDAQQRPHGRATGFLRNAGLQLGDAEPILHVPAAVRSAARARLGIGEAPFVAIGIGSSEELRRWPADRFGTVSAALLADGWPAIAILGGPDDAPAATTIRNAAFDPSRVIPVLGWPMDEVAGLLAEAAFYTGNDTGVMNMAAAVGVRSYAIFGRTPPVEHASQIVPITTPDIGVYDGVMRVTPDQVLTAIAADRAPSARAAGTLSHTGGSARVNT
ncbi:glycosyltransferase family 9 protein [Rhodopila sp.]|uniref:glycosyltransferase family 9 protein n=1 Tax=Rhodopila sp. TaxID=2480087 RepID=UPI002BC87D6F|nr:glycosyltransferase family 9 protein [Rhodopila sp.]HVZ06356.1 glycosyltransferase family 9 protein [Rhodopila sp.]